MGERGLVYSFREKASCLLVAARRCLRLLCGSLWRAPWADAMATRRRWLRVDACCTCRVREPLWGCAHVSDRRAMPLRSSAREAPRCDHRTKRRRAPRYSRPSARSAETRSAISSASSTSASERRRFRQPRTRRPPPRAPAGTPSPPGGCLRRLPHSGGGSRSAAISRRRDGARRSCGGRGSCSCSWRGWRCDGRHSVATARAAGEMKRCMEVRGSPKRGVLGTCLGGSHMSPRGGILDACFVKRPRVATGGRRLVATARAAGEAIPTRPPPESKGGHIPARGKGFSMLCVEWDVSMWFRACALAVVAHWSWPQNGIHSTDRCGPLLPVVVREVWRLSSCSTGHCCLSLYVRVAVVAVFDRPLLSVAVAM